MKLDTFDFELSPERIAQRPVVPRDAARLLVVGGRLRDRGVRDLPGLLRAGDVAVFNDTRVVPARLTTRHGARPVEVTLVKRVDAGAWRALARPARRLKVGDRIGFARGLSAAVAAKGKEGEVTLQFQLDGEDLMAALERDGAMPLPPYIKRPADARDRRDYQTVFAANPGAVAAPTAGLHFTPGLLAALDRQGVGRVSLTLHVGAGTFLPVRVTNVRDHRMHPEYGELSAAAAEAVNAARAAGGRVVAVGSTCLRLLEAAADEDGRLRPFAGETDIFIVPGYRFRVVDLLVTNFHLPRSTLFMLICAFAGIGRMKSAYEHAKRSGYRFYSYGDGCLLERDGAP